MTGALSFHLIQFRLLDPCAAGVYSVAVRCGPIHDQGAYGAACVLAEIVPLAFDLMPSSVHMPLGLSLIHISTIGSARSVNSQSLYLKNRSADGSCIVNPERSRVSDRWKLLKMIWVPDFPAVS